MHAAVDRLAEVYARFAAHEARGRSSLYEKLARGIAEDRQILRLLADLPWPKQQPNLLFAAVRHLCGTANGWAQFQGWLLERHDEILALIRTRRTQTNEPARLKLLRAAVEVARTDPPTIVRGDLRRDLPPLAAQAPRGATLVVFHTAVLAYIPEPAERAAFGRTMHSIDAVWIANEAPGLQTASSPPDHPWPAGFDPFLLTCDLRPVAWTDPHGTSIHWIE
jgi:hypothetical protein